MTTYLFSQQASGSTITNFNPDNGDVLNFYDENIIPSITASSLNLSWTGTQFTIQYGTKTVTLPVGLSSLRNTNFHFDNNSQLLFSDTDNSSLGGGTGDDQIIGRENSADTLNGGSGNDKLLGLSGNDSLLGIDGNDILDGGSGSDTLDGGSGSDTLEGGFGNDTLIGGWDNDSMSGGAGNDTYYFNHNDDIVTEVAGEGTADVIFSSVDIDLRTKGAQVENLTFVNNFSNLNGTGNDLNNTITGNNDNNVLSGGLGNDTVNGGKGNDSLSGNVALEIDTDYSADLLDGGEGDDSLFGGEGTDTLIGGIGNDILDGLANDGADQDSMVGGIGNDVYYVDESDILTVENLGEGTDTAISLYASSYTISANIENLALARDAWRGYGNELNNYMSHAKYSDGSYIEQNNNNHYYGRGGNDTIDGGEGSDHLDGGVGTDSLIGGSGNDYFFFSSALDSQNNVDVISDFSKVTGNTDKIHLDDDLFTALGNVTEPTALSAAAFCAGTQASSASHRIVYNQASGALFYDADGAGGTAQVQFALLGTANHPSLVASDFLIVEFS